MRFSRLSFLAVSLVLTFTGVGAAQARRTSEPPTMPEPALGHWAHPEVVPPGPAFTSRLKAPPGFEVGVFARDLGHARMLLALPDGTLLVSRPKTSDVVALRERGGQVEARTVASGIEMAHGLAYRDGRVYIAGVKKIYSAEARPDGTLGPLRLIVDDLPDGGQHPNRTLAFDPQGRLYVTVGSDCNDCKESNPEHATVLRMNADGTDRAVFASGLRNTLGFGFRPGTSDMWGLDHGVDWHGDALPPEEVNQLKAGVSYGWPYCWGDKKPDPSRDDPPDMTKAAFCASTQGPVLTLPSHAAPIGMAFYDGSQFPPAYRGDAIAALRGSWNREPAREPKIVRIRFQDGRAAGVEDFVTGFQSADGRTRWGRLAGVAVAPDGSVLFSDDENGVVYRVRYSGEARARATGVGVGVAPVALRPRPVSAADPANPTASAGEDTLRRVTVVKGLATPESVLHDPDQDVYFVSNINGKPLDKDGNGFISRVSPAGAVVSRNWITGGAKGVTLHAPKGMALQGDLLWVSDIDVMRAFDRRTGALARTVDLAPQGAVFLNDVAVGGDGDVYVTDMGVKIEPDGSRKHTGPDRIFRIARDGQATVAAQGEALGGPNGLAWDEAARRFIVVENEGKEILGWTPGSGEPASLAHGVGKFDGVAALGQGRFLVSSQHDDVVYLFDGSALKHYFPAPPKPADIGYDARRHRLLVPTLDADTVQIWQVPAAMNLPPAPTVASK